MLTDEQRADGWIEHDGGPCPVALDKRAYVLFRGGQIRLSRPAVWWTNFDSDFAEHDLWQHQHLDHSNDIIAYRLETPDAQ